MSALQFSIELKREWADKQADMGKIVRTVAMTGLRRVVDRSPVGDPTFWKTKYPPKGYTGGHFKANWFPSIGAPTAKTTTKKDKTGGATTERGLLVMSNYGKDGKFPRIIIQNNLPYAVALENGHSKRQAPAGIVALVKVELEAMFEGTEV